MALRFRPDNQVLPDGENGVRAKAASRIPVPRRAALQDIGNSATTSTVLGEGKPNQEFKKQVFTTAELSKILEQVPSVVQQQTSKVVEAFSVQQYSFPDVDANDHGNPQLMSQYVNDVYQFLRELEAEYPINAGFMSGMKVRSTMRAILVDWLVEVHHKFKLLPETLYLTIAVMDRFLQEDKNVTRAELQLVGLTSMFIASKYEEMYMPGVDEFIYMSDHAYTTGELLRMEIRILKALKFSLGRPLPLHFLRRYSKVASVINEAVDALHHTLAKYLMELTLPEYEFAHYKPSELAAGALFLSLRILDESSTSPQSLWNECMAHHSGYTAESLEPLICQYAALIESSTTNKYQAVRTKYASSKFYNISTCYKLGGKLVKTLAAKYLEIKP